MVALNQKLLFLLLSVLMLAGCREEEKIVAYRELRALPPAEIERRVTALSPQQQVDLYTMAISYFRPSDMQLAPLLAKQGTRILPPLIDQLDKAEPGVSPQELVFVLYLMATVYHVDEAKNYAARVDVWCSRFFKMDTSCHEMGREMAGLSP